MKANTKFKWLFLFFVFWTLGCFSQNPIIQTLFTPDPAPMVYENTVYLYTGNDEDRADYFTMNDWRVYSSKDMVNWTDHGVPLRVSDFKWSAENSAWAAQCIERNGKFYWYVSCEYPGHWHSVGVAVSDSPTGPFVDAIGKPLVATGEMGDIDPSVFIDDDGQAYLYWGNGKLSYVLLNEDMISYDEEVGVVDVIPFGTYGENKIVPQEILGGFGPKFEEAPWVYKRGDLYYNIYAAGGVPEDLSYSTAPTAIGPWTYRGKIMPVSDANKAFTNHPGIIDFKNNSYLFYHTGALPGGGGFNRSTCIEQFTYNEDGTIPQITITNAGVNGVATLNPYKRTEGETIAWSVGLKTAESDKVGVYVTQIDNKDYIKVRDVDFGEKGASVFTANVSSGGRGGSIELRVDALDGEIIGALLVSYTGGWDEWVLKTTNVKSPTGVHDLYLIFKGNELEEMLFNLDYWMFGEKKNESGELVAINATTDKYKIDIVSGVNTIQYNVSAVYSDGASEDVTSQAVLVPSKNGIVEISNGVITGVTYGETDITVSYNGQSDIIKVFVKDQLEEITLKSLSIDIENVNDIKLLRGNNLSYTVTAQYLDGRTQDVSKVVDLYNSNSSVIQISDGTITALADGISNATISYSDELGNAFSIDVKVTVETFPLSVEMGFNPSFWGEGTFDENTLTLITGQYGFGGWVYENGIDLSAYRYLVVELAEQQTSGTSLRLYDENNYWTEPSMHDFDNSLKVRVDLARMTKKENDTQVKCDPSHLYIIGFWSFGGSPIKFKRIFLSNDGQTPVEDSTSVPVVTHDENEIVNVYAFNGVKILSSITRKEAINKLTSGFYIIGKQKVLITK